MQKLIASFFPSLLMISISYASVSTLPSPSGGAILGVITVTGKADSCDKKTGKCVINISGSSFSAGQSLENPCSDLHRVGGGEAHQETIGSKPVTTEMPASFAKELGWPQVTCLKVDDFKDGKVYSTGNMQFTYDAQKKEYTAMTPKMVTLAFPGSN